MSDTVTVNGKEVAVDSLTDQQKNMVREAILARAVMEQHEYQFVLLKTRYDSIVRTLEEELTEEADGS